ncbi:UNVERIFIED_CONTAM: hypothetical protein FKN15_048280 [Acipenser sinensis]
MGRTYFVEDSVEQYLHNILDTSGKACVTGLLIGQCSPQRDFVLLAVRTPPKETQSDEVDEEWVVEHATQVSRMLPGGLAVLGVFLGAAPELSIQAQNILRRALKRDVLNTVAIRSQMLFEDFYLDPEGYTEKVSVFDFSLLKVSPTGVMICDYMFKDEAPKDIQFRIKELLDLDVKEDQLDMLLEVDSVFPGDYNPMQLKVAVAFSQKHCVLWAIPVEDESKHTLSRM